MTRLARVVAAAVAAAAVVGFSSAPRTAARLAPDAVSRQQVLLVSLDGFRWDYLNRPQARNLRRLAAEGVRAERMVPSYPSVTFPNHYTVVTGLYPDHHGIIANAIRDSTLGWFHIYDTAAVRNPAWWGGEPLWVTAEKQGERAGSFFWPGSEAAVEGVLPTRYMKFNDRFDEVSRVDTVLSWLTLPAPNRMSFVTLYYSDVDHAGHAFAPDSPQVDSAIARVDSMVGLLMDGIASRGLADRVNLVVVADHGMTAVSPDRVLFLDDYAAPSDFDVIDGGALGLIAPHAGRADAVFAELHGANPHMHAARRRAWLRQFVAGHGRALRGRGAVVPARSDGASVPERARVRSHLPHPGTDARAQRRIVGFDAGDAATLSHPVLSASLAGASRRPSRARSI